MVKNVHSRVLRSSPSEAGQLIDKLASGEDLLWPGKTWPPMKLDRPLGKGAYGGHGPIGYAVEEYHPGRRVVFRFTKPRGFTGIHFFDISDAGPGLVKISHVIEMSVSIKGWVMWHLAIRWLHDALVEDAFDRVEEFAAGVPVKRYPWSPWVRFLRWVLKNNG